MVVAESGSIVSTFVAHSAADQAMIKALTLAAVRTDESIVGRMDRFLRSIRKMSKALKRDLREAGGDAAVIEFASRMDVYLEFIQGIQEILDEEARRESEPE